MYLVLFIGALAFLILAHELGHFIVAKRNGIRVDEFGIGFPPRLFKYKKGETIYSINLLPLGGFVKIYGEDGLEEGEVAGPSVKLSLTECVEKGVCLKDLPSGSIKELREEEKERSFAFKSVGVRSKVIAAGVICNFIVGWLLLSTGLMFGLPISTDAVSTTEGMENIQVVIIDVSKDSPASEAGLLPGDELIGFSTITDVQKFVVENKGKEVELKYKRGMEEFSVNIIPRVEVPDDQGALGIGMSEVGVAKFSWYIALWEGARLTFRLAYSIVITLYYFVYDLIKGVANISAVMGPVGIVHHAVGTVAQLGLVSILSFIALLSINLGVLNLMPFPALDGGRLLFLFIEKIKGSPINPRFNAITNGIGLLLLLALMAVITYNDVLGLM